MKTLLFQGGLGNQLFQYAFYRYLVAYIDNNVRAVIHKGNNHDGFQLLDYFDVHINMLSGIRLLLFRVIEFLSIKGIIHANYATEDTYLDNKSNYIADYFINDRYISPNFVTFKNLNLEGKNSEVFEKIINNDSVSIHIRRGDYLLPQYKEIYGNVCTLEYYQKAINLCKQRTSNPLYFVFSDDIEWAQNNLPIKNACYVNWNTGKQSPIDMYLMSHCKMNIIANSTFSFWGAYLNNNGSRLVIYPQKWYNSKFEAPKIFPKGWIAL